MKYEIRNTRTVKSEVSNMKSEKGSYLSAPPSDFVPIAIGTLTSKFFQIDLLRLNRATISTTNWF
jgi:hypothetical protein